MRDITTRLSAMTPQQRRSLPCIGQERADLVVAGCAILDAILDIWPAPRLGVADRGIREGILRGLMAADAEGFAAQAALRRLKQGGECGVEGQDPPRFAQRIGEVAPAAGR